MDRKEWVDDAIIGLDVGDGDEDDSSPRRSSNKTTKRAAASSKGAASIPRKRPRSKPASSRPQKPKPPPAPPASLVSLMKKDKSVLHFFTSLQENVTYDVDKWKHEAAHWKRMASSASKQNVNGTKKTNTTKKVQQKSNEDKKKQCNRRLLGGTNNNVLLEEGSTIPITDEALFGESNNDEDNNDEGYVCSENAVHLNSAVEKSRHDAQTLQNRSLLILGKLIEAKSLLDLLGVSLIVVETKSPPTNEVLLQTNDKKESTHQLDAAAADNDDDDDGVENEKSSFLNGGLTDKTAKGVEMHIIMAVAAERILHSQSDEKVVADMMASLRTLIEASSFMNNHKDVSEQQNYHPFYRCGKPHCPSVYFGTHSGDIDQFRTTWQHPASVGLKYLIDALAIMDVYCRDNFDEEDWELIFEDGSDHGILSEEDMAILKIGMRNRCHLVEKLLSSLHVEITRTWANTERASNLDSSAMHFYPTDVINEGNICDAEGEFAYSVKNFNRLVSLEERIAHGRIASLLQRRVGAFQKATELVLGYVISAVPSLGIEHYHPKIPPALSMCVLESLLSPEDYDPADAKSKRNDEWFSESIQFILSSNSNKIPEECSSLLLKATAFATRAAANIWKERCSSTDKRIRDIALIEVTAYKRLLRLSNGAWLNIVGSDEEGMQWNASEILSLCNDSKNSKLCTEKLSQAETGLSCIISLINVGKSDEIMKLCESIVTSLKNERCSDNKRRRRLFLLLPACCFAYKSIMSRKWESIKLVSVTSGRHTAAAFGLKNEFTCILEAAADVVVNSSDVETDWTNVDVIIQCYKLVGDALGLHRFAKRVLLTMNAVEEGNSTVASQTRAADTSRIMSSSLLDAAATVTVRVINLERRPDRLLDFTECAVNSEQMLVMKAVAKLKPKNSVATCDEGGETTGNFAFDGQCSKDELETKIAQITNGLCALSDFVKEEWKPSELSAFDKHAGSDFKDAHTTTSETACALSHIGTWYGVESSLSCLDSGFDKDSKAVNLEKITGLLTVSGFARGTPLLNENEGMDPSPVCVILEDDAMLCDRFVERLEALLDELPRDFHFCSIGYSRPKFAPIVEYSQEIGIPSCLWYLTGYVLSAAGASFLNSSLPVVGPVDSWIAVKLRDNFANSYGDSIGVGKHARAHNLSSPSDLSKMLKFRAFAAKVPLCTQKQAVVSQSKATRGGGNWRAAKMDSDVVYSGY